MKKYIIFHLLLCLSVIFTKGQGQPSGFPITNSTGWIKYGYLQNDSGRIDAKRDTNWTPSKVPTTVYWEHAGVDTAFWTFNGKSTGNKKWDKTSAPTSGIGTVTSVGLSVPSVGSPFLGVSGTPVTTSGTLALSALGTSSQIVLGNGSLGSALPTAIIPTLQQTITAGSALTSTVNITGAVSLSFTDQTSFNVIKSSVGRLAITNATTQIYAPGGSTGIILSTTAASMGATGNTNIDAPIINIANSTAGGSTINIGGGTTVSELVFLEGSAGGTNYVGFKSNATLAGNTVYTLPIAFPAGTYLLNSTNAGVMGFTDPSTFLTGLTVGTTTIASGTIGGVIFQGAGNVVQQDATNLFWDDTNNRLGVGTNAPANTFDALSSGTAGRFKSSGYSSSTLIIEDPDGTTYITNGQFKVNTVPFVLNANASYITFQTSGVEKLRIDNTGNIIFGGAATAPDFRFLEGSGGGTNYVGFKANATLAGNTIYTLPTAFPAGTYLLNSTSAGVMGFTDPSTLTGLPYIAITGTSNLTGATTVEMGGQNFTVSDGSTTANIVLSPNAGQIELTLDGTAKTFTAIASSGYFFNTGTVQMNAYGAGAATFDASGNITSVSDERLKNIQGDYEVGLKQVMKINPIVYKWKPESHLETEHSYIGFSAQNILYSLGENAIGRNKDGYLSIQDRGILAALVNSVKELNEKVIEQQKEINKLKKNK